MTYLSTGPRRPLMYIMARHADMHERAELGEAAHTAYKGRLESWWVQSRQHISVTCRLQWSSSSSTAERQCRLHDGLLAPDANRQHDQLQAWTATVPTDIPLATHATRKQRAQAAAVELFRSGHVLSLRCNAVASTWASDYAGGASYCSIYVNNMHNSISAVLQASGHEWRRQAQQGGGAAHDCCAGARWRRRRRRSAGGHGHDCGPADWQHRLQRLLALLQHGEFVYNVFLHCSPGGEWQQNLPLVQQHMTPSSSVGFTEPENLSFAEPAHVMLCAARGTAGAAAVGSSRWIEPCGASAGSTRQHLASRRPCYDGQARLSFITGRPPSEPDSRQPQPASRRSAAVTSQRCTQPQRRRHQADWRGAQGRGAGARSACCRASSRSGG